MRKVLVTDKSVTRWLDRFPDSRIIVLVYKDHAVIDSSDIELLKIELSRREIEKIAHNRRELLKILEDYALTLGEIDLQISFLNDPLANIAVPLHHNRGLRGVLSYMVFDVKDLIESRNIYALLKELTYYSFINNGYTVVLDYDKIRDTNIYDIVFDIFVNERIEASRLEDIRYVGVALKRVKTLAYYKEILSRLNQIRLQVREYDQRVKELDKYIERIESFIKNKGSKYTVLLNDSREIISTALELIDRKELVTIGLPLRSIDEIIVFTSSDIRERIESFLGKEKIYPVPGETIGSTIVIVGLGRIKPLEENVFTRKVSVSEPLREIGEIYFNTPYETLKQAHYSRISPLELVKAIPLLAYDCLLFDSYSPENIFTRLQVFAKSLKTLVDVADIGLDNIREVVDALLSIYSIDVRSIAFLLDSAQSKCIIRIDDNLKSLLAEASKQIPSEEKLSIKLLQILDNLADMMFLVDDMGDKEYSEKIRFLSEIKVEEFIRNILYYRELLEDLSKAPANS